MTPSSTPKMRQRGFSLLELTISILLFSVLIGSVQLSFTRRMAQELEQDQAELAAGQIYRLANAAQHYEILNSEWPDELMQCADAQKILRNASLLSNANMTAPYQDARGRAHAYITTCANTTHFSVSINTESVEHAARLAQKIPTAAITNSRVDVHYPRAAALASEGDYLPLDGSASPTDTLDFGNQYVFGVKDVLASTGQTLLNSVQHVTTAKHGDTIKKPACPSGMQPHIFTALNQVQTSSGRPLHAIQLLAKDNGNSWTVNAVVTGSAGNETVSVRDATITAFVKCSY